MAAEFLGETIWIRGLLLMVFIGPIITCSRNEVTENERSPGERTGAS